MKAELKVLNRKAQESEKMKQAFINSICHEIRTPLNSIVGFSDLIMNEDIDEETRREFPARNTKKYPVAHRACQQYAGSGESGRFGR